MCIRDRHGEDGLQIAFTSGNDSFVVQQGKGKAAGGSRLVYQAEAAEGNGCLLYTSYSMALPMQNGSLRGMIWSMSIR